MKKYEMNMAEGSILKNLVFFSVPLILSSVLQLLFNAADIVIVGRFDGDTALAAVGSTTSLIHLILNIFIGYSTGASVVISRYFGAGNETATKKAVSTSITTACLFGIIVMVLGITVSRTLLELMNTPGNVIDGAATYMKIYFIGVPALMLYNFGSGVLRAIGDTKRPLAYLTVAGIINVILNLIFVIKFHMGVAGVALATTISQTVSAACVVICLIKTKECYGIDIKSLRIHKKEFLQMTKIGLPAGIQGSLFSISNVIVQSSINAFGSLAVAGNSAAQSVEGFVYVILNSIAQGCLTFTGQNFGAGKAQRIKKGTLTCLALELVVVFSISIVVLAMGNTVLGFYTDKPEAISIGFGRLSVICFTYFLCGFNEVVVSHLRGLGCSALPTAVSVFGICGVRILYILTVYKYLGTLESLYVVYPLSWIVSFIINGAAALLLWRRLTGKLKKI